VRFTDVEKPALSGFCRTQIHTVWAILGLAAAFTALGGESEAHPRRRASAPSLDSAQSLPASGITGVRTNDIPVAGQGGVYEFHFRDLFRSPAGPAGLEYSARAQALAGKPVRITGYIVRQSQPIPWAFLLSPIPQSLHEREYGLCDDLPVTAIHVFLPRSAQPLPPRYSGPVSVTGILELGGKEEADERVSVARIRIQGPVTSTVVPLPAPAVAASRQP
jgi:hypothetical protein